MALRWLDLFAGRPFEANSHLVEFKAYRPSTFLRIFNWKHFLLSIFTAIFSRFHIIPPEICRDNLGGMPSLQVVPYVMEPVTSPARAVSEIYGVRFFRQKPPTRILESLLWHNNQYVERWEVGRNSSNQQFCLWMNWIQDVFSFYLFHLFTSWQTVEVSLSSLPAK